MKRTKQLDFPQIIKKARNKNASELLNDFTLWCKENKLSVSDKVKACLGDPCSNYGMVATTDIENGECLFEIPRGLLLQPQNSAISQVLEGEKESLKSSSGWVPLLIALMYEYTNPHSKWKPYLTAFPDFDELDLPMFWDSKERNTELEGTGILESVEKDLSSMEAEFDGIVLPFVNKHSTLFTECSDVGFYKKMVAFVMAYSFTEPISVDDNDDSDSEEMELQKSPPMMVPMADILNHVAKNNAHLDFCKESLKMVATKDIKMGEEIFNTYGELSNSQLLHMYGFAEPYPNNFYDTVEVPMTKAEKYLSQSDLTDDTFTDRWQILLQHQLITKDGAFVIGEEGILNEEEMLETCKVLTMDQETLKQYRDSDGWVEDDEDDVSLLKDDLKFLPQKWQDIIKILATNALKEYGNRNLTSDEELLHPDRWQTLSRQQQYSLYVRYGQFKLWGDIISACQSNIEKHR